MLFPLCPLYLLQLRVYYLIGSGQRKGLLGVGKKNLKRGKGSLLFSSLAMWWVDRLQVTQ